MSSPVFVFGISGATWSVAEPLIAAGRLPNMARLQDGGCSAKLLSVLVDGDKHFRPQVAWASLATGCEPQRHGVTRFYHTADDLRVPAIWDVFAQHGRRAGIYGWPLDWPPPRVDGFVVPSHLARDTRTWPPELSCIKALDREQQNAERVGGGRSAASSRLRTARTLMDHGARLRTLASIAATVMRSTLLADAEQRSLMLRRAKLDLSADLFLGLCRRFQPELRTFHTFLVDFVSHRFWRYHEPELFADASGESAGRFGNAVTEAYVQTDRVLGRMIAALPPGSTIAVMSEHGMRAEPESTEVGEWRYVIDPLRLSALVGLERQIVGAPVARWIAYRSRTREPLPTDTVERLRRVRVLETDLPLFQIHLHGRDEIVVKLSIERSVPRYREGSLEALTLAYDDVRVPFSEVTRRLGRARSAMHDGEGMLLLAGPNIPRGMQLPDVQLVDVAPTLLAAAGLPLPRGLDGKPLFSAGLGRQDDASLFRIRAI